MKITQFLTRLVLIIFVCGLVVFGNISPANAAWGRASSQTKGVVPLPNITDKAEETANSGPSGISSKVNKGLNEVQGTADFNRMERDNYGDKLPVVREAERAADKVDNKIKSVKEDVENSANSVLDQASDVVSDVKDKAGDAFNSITGKAADTAKAVKQKVKS